jgi:hypothetical protein
MYASIISSIVIILILLLVREGYSNVAVVHVVVVEETVVAVSVPRVVRVVSARRPKVGTPISVCPDGWYE